MNQLRQPFSELSPEVYKGLVQASIALEKSELGNALVELVYLRVSQINGCAFCLEKHSQALRKGGMAQSKLGNDSNLLIVFYVQIMPDDFVMQLHRF